MTSTPASRGKTPITLLLGTTADQKLSLLSFEHPCVSQSRGWGKAYSVHRDNLEALRTRLERLYKAETHDADGAYTCPIDDLGKWGTEKIMEVTDEAGSLMSRFLPNTDLTKVWGAADEAEYISTTQCLRDQMERACRSASAPVEA